MKLLLDTHIFLWYINADQRLPINILDAIRNPDNSIYLSVASIWEVSIKSSTGKLILPESPSQYLISKRKLHQIISLPVDEFSIMHLNELPLLHRDPFDRIIIAQCKQHYLTLATADSAMRAYPVSLI